MISTHLTLLLSVTTFFTSCSTFLLVDNCPAPSPCTCSGSSISSSYINCNSKSLKEIPRFGNTSNHVTTLYVYLQYNGITVVHNNAFSNLSAINATNIDLRIHNNHIHTIENNAFHGIENATTALCISDNNLTSIPDAVGKLVNLKYLYIYNNPLHSLDSSVMSKIGRSLIYLYFDMSRFLQWPSELHYLRMLQTLIIRSIHLKHLDINAFHGFENTLTQLEILNPKLEKVPYAICSLNHLTLFVFVSNTQLKENRSSIFEPCAGKLVSVSNLQLQSNSLHSFPDVFTLFPSLTYLYLDNNQLEYIDSVMIPSNSKLLNINLNNNMFERIPSALNKLKSLQILHIEGNNIKTIESADVYGLSMLSYLDLKRNPLIYISPYAFNHNTNLQTLDLQNTNLDHVPVAVTHLPSLRGLYLSGKPIDCTCDMAYLKHWSVSAVTFNTLCASTSETIKSFVMGSLQSCQ